MAVTSPQLPALVFVAAILALPTLGAARLGGNGVGSAAENATRWTSGAGSATALANETAGAGSRVAQESSNRTVLNAATDVSLEASAPAGGRVPGLLAARSQGARSDAAASLWRNVSVNTSSAALAGGLDDVTVNARGVGFKWAASTTRYGNSETSSCGGLNTETTVAGTGYYSVASSQAMQSAFLWGASCCYCGAAAESQAALGTAPMGCFQCARGRFLKRQAHAHGSSESGFATDEIKIVVLDVCPGDATGWCQAKPGDVNVHGMKNHLDFSVPPPGINNNYFVFTPEECSPELKERLVGAKTKCFR